MNSCWIWNFVSMTWIHSRSFFTSIKPVRFYTTFESRHVVNACIFGRRTCHHSSRAIFDGFNRTHSFTFCNNRFTNYFCGGGDYRCEYRKYDYGDLWSYGSDCKCQARGLSTYFVQCDCRNCFVRAFAISRTIFGYFHRIFQDGFVGCYQTRTFSYTF